MAAELSWGGGNWTLAEAKRLIAEPVALALTQDARTRIARSHETIASILRDNRVVYGINTGFGLLANTRIAPADLEALQENLVLSHAAGVGAPLADETVRLILALKVNSLARGASGVRHEVVDALIALLKADALPVIPSQGSVGASGDLAPLAHLSAALLGHGTIRLKGVAMPAKDALARIGLAPLTLKAKEGLALLNGTQVSNALALHAFIRLENLFGAFLVAGALSTDAIKGSDTPFDARIHLARGQRGQIAVADVLRRLMAGSVIRQSHNECERVQDPYSFRCQPQVMGAAFDMMASSLRTLEIEANAASDNPLVFAEDGDVLSGGNFHAEPVAMAADAMAIAMAEVGALSERRLAILIDPKMSGLPAFLVRDGGLNSGFMIAQVTAAALASENKHIAHPASIDSLPTSANQEDHVSMATFAARRLHTLADNLASMCAIELLAAAQGIDFHRPARSSQPLEEAMSALRARVPFYERDRLIATDIEAAKSLVESGALLAIANKSSPQASFSNLWRA